MLTFHFQISSKLKIYFLKINSIGFHQFASIYKINEFHMDIAVLLLQIKVGLDKL